MRYGRTASGDAWHPLDKDGHPFCHARDAGIVETRDREDIDPDRVCQNCDAHLREKGKQARRKLAAKKRRPRRDVYEPRHRFKE